MRTPTLLALLGVLALSACGGSHAPPRTTPTSNEPAPGEPSTPPAASAPRSLDEALATSGLVHFEPTVVSREMSHTFPDRAQVEGRRITLHVSAGWNQSSPVFARRANGHVVLVESRPTTIVDRHVPGGCVGFAGGRAWFETIVYELPEGATYDGPLVVTWENHIEVVDHTDTQADGSPCPPPAID